MDRGKVAAALLVVLVGGALLVAVLTALPAAPSEAESPWIGPWLWEVRGMDLVAQALLVLAGVLGVLLLIEDREGAG